MMREKRISSDEASKLAMGTLKQAEEERLRAADDDANREMDLSGGEDWGNK